MCNCAARAVTTRGFTGEEQFPVDCLVNLNARLYDPIIGRFMAADPVVSSVYDLQALNRFSYVHNNPLSFTDPDGQCGPFCIVLIAAAIVSATEVLKPVFERVPILGDLFIIADGIACGPIGLGPVCAAEAAGSIAGVESGNVGKGLEAFVLTFAEAEAFDEVGNLKGDFSSGKFGVTIRGDALTATSFVLHGLVGGTFSVAKGSNFGSGFLAGGVSDLASPYIEDLHTGNLALGTVESAVVGGVSSVLGGGKLDNGAITGAFGYLYNAGLHNGRAPLDRHQLGVDAAIADYESRGYEVISATPVAVNVPGFSGPRYYDFLVLDPVSGDAIGVEVKTTLYDTIRLNTLQVAKDVQVIIGGGTVQTTGQPVQGVGYFTYCFACNLVDIRSFDLYNTLLDLNVPFAHGGNPGVYFSPPKVP